MSNSGPGSIASLAMRKFEMKTLSEDVNVAWVSTEKEMQGLLE